MRRTKRKRKIRNNTEWIVTVTSLAFIISIIMGFFGELILGRVGFTISVLVTLVFIILGILFDLIGVAVTAADIHVFNSMASKKVKGSSIAVKMINSAERVSSICCDVVGDICGVASGSSGVTIAALVIEKTDANILFVSAIVTAIISMFTIGGKALGKGYAIKNSTVIVQKVGSVLSGFRIK